MKHQPTTDRGRASLRRILDAGSDCFYRAGVGATSLDDICAASATGRSQLYHYFTNKADLVLAVIDHQVDQVLAAQQPLLDTFSTREELRTWCGLAVELYARSDDPVRCPLGALTAELAEGDPDARAALAAGFARWTAALAAGIARMQHRGEAVREHPADDMAAALLAAYQGGLLLAQASGDLDALRQALTVTRTAIEGPSASVLAGR